MPRTRRFVRPAAAAATALAAWLGLCVPARTDTVVLKNGIVYRGTVDRDNTILWVYDGLKRVVLRDSKVARIESDAAYRSLEVFKIEQPMVVHGGSMPKEVTRVEPSPWNDRGRRAFAFEGAKAGKLIKMEQAINELGPHLVKIRGVDGFWQSQLATSQVPREVVLAILAKVDQKDQKERIRAARWLIQAEWYPEARAELDRIARDFADDADLRERVTAVRRSTFQLEAEQIRAAIDRCKTARQPNEYLSRLRTFPTKDVGAELLTQVRDLVRTAEGQAAADKALADDLRALADQVPTSTQTTWKAPLLEVLQALRDAPDAVRERLVAWQKAKVEGGKTPEALLALALSGYVVGSDAAVDDLALASTYWSMRDNLRAYLTSQDAAARSEIIAKLEAASLPVDPDQSIAHTRTELATRIAQRMPPPLHQDEDASKPQNPKIHRVRDDENPKPTDYVVSLPPEYHPLRSYPTVVALHDGQGPTAAVAWWAAEAAKRGYIVVAPEYRLSEQKGDYSYSTPEHAAVELALRDAKRRYAIDSDRVFLGGQLTGADMAWDFGLAHPDLFAGLVTISGRPFKYVFRYLQHAEHLPLYVVLGDLAPAATELVFAPVLKPMIAKAWDVTYAEYLRRGPESFPEEAESAFDWMDHRPDRDPYAKAFEVVTGRPSDNRFFGIVAREFRPGRTTAPEAVEPFGKNLNPAKLSVKSSALSNLLDVKTDGIKSLDIWVSPKLLDFKKRMEIRINGRALGGGKRMATPDLEAFLEDLRIRGDRQQVYWLKVSAG
jgi:predicted esterase